MTVINNNPLITLYTKTMLNFGAVYAATQESMKSQASSLAAMQGQLANIQQFCITSTSPQTTATPPHSNSARSTTEEEEAEVEAAADTASVTNN